jgi:hypothetical protein
LRESLRVLRALQDLNEIRKIYLGTQLRIPLQLEELFEVCPSIFISEQTGKSIEKNRKKKTLASSF